MILNHVSFPNHGAGPQPDLPPVCLPHAGEQEAVQYHQGYAGQEVDKDHAEPVWKIQTEMKFLHHKR